MPVRVRRHASLALALAVVACLGSAGPIRAETEVADGDGRTLIVSRSDGLDPEGETVTVSGSGFSEEKGIYVAFCVDRGPGALPQPCGGGIDTSGASGASVWISSNPPPYGRELAVPYEDGGTFSVTIRVSATIGDHDCTRETCAIVTRNDHTRTDDRSQDLAVPIGFATFEPLFVAGGVAGLAALVGGSAWWFLAHRRRHPAGVAQSAEA